MRRPYLMPGISFPAQYPILLPVIGPLPSGPVLSPLAINYLSFLIIFCSFDRRTMLIGFIFQLSSATTGSPALTLTGSAFISHSAPATHTATWCFRSRLVGPGAVSHSPSCHRPLSFGALLISSWHLFHSFISSMISGQRFHSLPIQCVWLDRSRERSPPSLGPNADRSKRFFWRCPCGPKPLHNIGLPSQPVLLPPVRHRSAPRNPWD